MLEPLQPCQYYRDELGPSDALVFARQDLSPERLLNPFRLREAFVHQYGFAILTQETHAALVRLFEGYKVMEAGSGTGYVSKALRDAGIDITAVDSNTGTYGFVEPYVRDVEADATSLLPGAFEAVLLIWPCYSKSFGYDVISRMRAGQILVFQGEGHGGCTADDDFFEELETERWKYIEKASDALNEGHVQFFGIHDTWSVYERRDPL